MNRRAFFGLMAGVGVVGAGRTRGVTERSGFVTLHYPQMRTAEQALGRLYVAEDGGWGVPCGEDLNRYVLDINFVDVDA